MSPGLLRPYHPPAPPVATDYWPAIEAAISVVMVLLLAAVLVWRNRS